MSYKSGVLLAYSGVWTTSIYCLAVYLYYPCVQALKAHCMEPFVGGQNVSGAA